MSFPCDPLCQSAVTQYVIPLTTTHVIPWLDQGIHYRLCHSLISTRESLRATDCRVKPDNDRLSKFAGAMHNNDRLGKFAEAIHNNDRPGKIARPDSAMSFFACLNVLACHLPPVSVRHQKRVYYNTDFCTLR